MAPGQRGGSLISEPLLKHSSPAPSSVGVALSEAGGGGAQTGGQGHAAVACDLEAWFRAPPLCPFAQSHVRVGYRLTSEDPPSSRRSPGPAPHAGPQASRGLVAKHSLCLAAWKVLRSTSFHRESVQDVDCGGQMFHQREGAVWMWVTDQAPPPAGGFLLGLRAPPLFRGGGHPCLLSPRGL